MIITWHGQSCFTIAGDKNIIVTDPFDNSYGLKIPRLSAHIVSVSHDHHDHNNIAAVKGVNSDQPFVVNGPGEYEVENVFIYGISSFHDDSQGKERGLNTMYRFEIDGISVVHLGDLGHIPSAEQLQKLEETDILLIPVGGTYTINGKQANQIITQIEPRVVIPMHYQISGLKLKDSINDLDIFCKEIGICPKETLPKYKISKKDLLQQDLQVILLQP